MSAPKLLGQTPSQTVGPFFAYSLTPEQYGYPMTSIAGPVMADETTPGLRIFIEGRVLDGAGAPVTDALIEFWQPDAQGVYATNRQASELAGRRFTGFGRCGTGMEPGGIYRFKTIKPGVATLGEAPHINIIVMMRGLLLHAFTRLYFSDENSANATDPVLTEVNAARRHTLVAALVSPNTYRFDIRMQGEAETVFFDI
jgi:protocatechuate 3,4-dioxygenase, alpha subunit